MKDVKGVRIKRIIEANVFISKIIVKQDHVISDGNVVEIRLISALIVVIYAEGGENRNFFYVQNLDLDLLFQKERVIQEEENIDIRILDVQVFARFVKPKVADDDSYLHILVLYYELVWDHFCSSKNRV